MGYSIYQSSDFLFTQKVMAINGQSIRSANDQNILRFLETHQFVNKKGIAVVVNDTVISKNGLMPL